MIKSAHLPRQLIQLNEIARSLAQTRSLKDVKAVRDKAEAARNYAQSAALGLKIQNQAAELKLRAERRAGELLGELVIHGGNRKSRSHDETLKLADLGIERNQSSRWQREAAVPEKVFEEYVATANRMGWDITAQGLLRIERSANPQRRGKLHRTSGTGHSCNGNSGVGGPTEPSGKISLDSAGDSQQELLSELKNHQDLLENILTPFCNNCDGTLELSERRMVLRLMRESQQLINRLERQLLRSHTGHSSN